MTTNDTECTVCGDGLTIQRDTPKKLRSGIIYHFCSEACRDRFVNDPEGHTNQRRTTRAP